MLWNGLALARCHCLSITFTCGCIHRETRLEASVIPFWETAQQPIVSTLHGPADLMPLPCMVMLCMYFPFSHVSPRPPGIGARHLCPSLVQEDLQHQRQRQHVAAWLCARLKGGGRARRATSAMLCPGWTAPPAATTAPKSLMWISARRPSARVASRRAALPRTL